MASEIGWVDTTGNAFVSILLAEGQTMEFLIETGFNGELMLPFGVAQNLSLPITGEENYLVVGGETLTSPTSIAQISYLGTIRVAEVILSSGPDQLIGTELLRGTLLKIDYINRLVEIEKP